MVARGLYLRRAYSDLLGKERQLAEALTRLAADVLRAGVAPPLVVRNAAGDVVGTLAISET